MAQSTIKKERVINSLTVSLLNVSVTTSDQAGYYGYKALSELPDGATPFSIIVPSFNFTGGASYNLLQVDNGWRVLIASPKSFTFPSSGVRDLKIYYYI